MNQWPELIPQLVANVTDPSSTEHMKESTLEAIGYICQDIVSHGEHVKARRLLLPKCSLTQLFSTGPGAAAGERQPDPDGHHPGHEEGGAQQQREAGCHQCAAQLARVH